MADSAVVTVALTVLWQCGFHLCGGVLYLVNLSYVGCAVAVFCRCQREFEVVTVALRVLPQCRWQRCDSGWRFCGGLVGVVEVVRLSWLYSNNVLAITVQRLNAATLSLTALRHLIWSWCRAGYSNFAGVYMTFFLLGYQSECDICHNLLTLSRVPAAFPTQTTELQHYY